MSAIRPRLILLFIITLPALFSPAQDIVRAAQDFAQSFDSVQRLKLLYPFDTEERYRFFYFPVNNRKGISFDQMNPNQKKAAVALIKASLSQHAAEQVSEIMQLESILRSIEGRTSNDRYRDPERYFLTIFGIPANNTIWGWRVDGHHICFSFYVQMQKLVSGTPGFMGAHPAVVEDGPKKGQEILKEERESALALLHSLNEGQMKKVIIAADAPGDIITRVDRKAIIDHPMGLPFAEMNSNQQQLFLNLISVYIHRYTKLFADDMLKQIQSAGMNKLMFAWAGATETGIGHPHYYRIQGPTLLIEYDNTQDDANHVHTVVRDLQHDFGGDELLEHYKTAH
jgi:Protein of unknown function (DUF3500)